MANPYSRQCCAPIWLLVSGSLWIHGLGVYWSQSYQSPCWYGNEWGGRTPGSTHYVAGGAVGPHGLSPEAAGRVSSYVAAGPRAYDSHWQGHETWMHSAESPGPSLSAPQNQNRQESNEGGGNDEWWHWHEEGEYGGEQGGWEGDEAKSQGQISCKAKIIEHGIEHK